MEVREACRNLRWMPLLMTLAALGEAMATPLQSGNVLLSTGNTLYEYTQAGAWVRTVPIPYPGGTRPVTETARDMVVDASGNPLLYNGTFDPYLSRYDVATGSWTHVTHAGWSTANNGTYGGLARFENFVFATDTLTYGAGDMPRGLVRFELGGAAPVRFADTVDFIDVTAGQDGLLYGLASNEYTVYVYHPSTLALVRTVSLPFGSSIRGIAVSQTGEIYGASWDDHIYRFSAAGVQISRLYSGTYDLVDIDLSEEGVVIVGSRFGQVLFTDLQLLNLRSFTVGNTNVFVMIVPELASPTTDNLLVTIDNTVQEYTVDGQFVRSIPIPTSDYARDLTVSPGGGIEIYNGTFTPSLSRYDDAAAAWTHWTYAGWSTVNNVSYGGVASWQDFVFVSDMATAGAGAPRGLIRFDLSTGAASRFADTVDYIDVTVGLDGWLYALASNEYTVHVYNPSTLALVRTVSLPAYVRAITASATGELYGASWDDFIYRFSASGVLLGQVHSGAYDLIDIDISSVTEEVAVGSRFGTVILTDLELGNLRSIAVGNSEVFVSFRTPATSSN